MPVPRAVGRGVRAAAGRVGTIGQVRPQAVACHSPFAFPLLTHPHRGQTRYDDSSTLTGDKVRIKGPTHQGARGIVAHIAGEDLAIRLTTGDVLTVPSDNVTNFSLAARRAWRTVPERAVGRPKSQATAKKKAVTIRVDAEMWDRLGQAVKRGLIPSREQAVNAWVREHLETLLDEQTQKAGPDTEVYVNDPTLDAV